MPLLTLANAATPFPAALLHSPGAFLWWYAELFDAHGNGIVLIWSFGLPFLPGLASDARRGIRVSPRTRPSVNVAVYRNWALDGYLLREFAQDEATWSSAAGQQRWRFGDSVFELEGGELRACLDLPFLGSDTVRGEVVIHGLQAHGHGAEQGTAAHVWAPQVVLAEGSAALNIGSARYAIAGRGYVDGNHGDRPLGDSLDHWSWGRVPRDDHEVVYYLLTRGTQVESYLVTIADGEVRAERAAVQKAMRRGRFGLSYPCRLRLDGAEHSIELSTGALLDDGPFYVRYQLRDREGRCGTAEHCDTRRIDLARHRALVRMRVHSTAANSIWLPLFCGARRDRALNLVTHWVSR